MGNNWQDKNVTHGLAGDTVPSPWPSITQNETAKVLKHFVSCTAPIITWQSPRPFSSAVLAQCDNQTYFIKRHAQALRTVEELTNEHRLITHLRNKGLPTPFIYHTPNGQSCLALNGWVYEVLKPLSGVDSYGEVPSWVPITHLVHAKHAGSMLAQLHLAAADFKLPNRHTHLLVSRDNIVRSANPIATIEQQLNERPALNAFLQTRTHWQTELADLVNYQAVIQADLAEQPSLWTHNDWHLSNLGWQGDNISDVFDFGLSANTFALYDLATAIERNGVSWLELEKNNTQGFADTALALIKGYCDVIPLAVKQLKLLIKLLPVVHWDFALSEVEYFWGIEQTPASALVAWEVFLLGHFKWFFSKNGKAFINTLNNQIEHISDLSCCGD